MVKLNPPHKRDSMLPIFIFSALAAAFVTLFVSRLAALGANISRYKAEVSTLKAELPSLTAIVPMRNEEAHARRVLACLLAQDYPADSLRIVVVNDNSTDRTADILQELSAAHPNLSWVDAPSLPEGWKGKNHACFVGQSHAEGEYICFIDADVQLKPHVLREAVLYAQNHQADLLSLSPMQLAESAGEKVLLSGLFLAVAAIVDPHNRPNHERVTPNGQFMLFKRSAYDQLGGHATIRSEISDDLALGRLVKRRGLRYKYAVAEAGSLTTRMYDSFGSAWKGFRKNILEITDTHSLGKLLFGVLYLLTLSFAALGLPVMVWQAHQLHPWNITLLADVGLTALVWAIFLFYGRQLRLGLPATLFIPFSLPISAYLLAHSFAKRHRPQTVVWKGRTY